MAGSRARGAQAQGSLVAATPASEAAEPASTAVYVDLVVNTAETGACHRICRRLCLACPADLLAAVAALHDHVERAFAAAVISVDVRPCTSAQFAAVRESPVHFVNICGKITHCRASHVLNPAVLPLVVSVRALS